MPYKVHKMIEDRRNNTCGFFLPNGGFYYVMEMTFENHKQLCDISARHGYSVDLVEGPTGFFDSEGYEVERETVKVHPIAKIVESYDRKTKTYAGKSSSKPVVHKEVERPDVLRRASDAGLRNTEWTSTQSLKQTITQVKKQPQQSLAVQAQ